MRGIEETTKNEKAGGLIVSDDVLKLLVHFLWVIFRQVYNCLVLKECLESLALFELDIGSSLTDLYKEVFELRVVRDLPQEFLHKLLPGFLAGIYLFLNVSAIN